MILINPPNSSVGTKHPHLGILYLAATLEKAGKPVVVLNCQCLKNYRSIILKALKDHEEVGITVNVFTSAEAKDLARIIRSYLPEKRIIMGGPYATVMYKQLIPDYADIVVLGEGEETIVELMDGKALDRIKGIAYWDGEIKVNSPRELIENLDFIPFPAYHLTDIKGYRFSAYRALPLVTMISSRGCPPWPLKSRLL